MGKVGGGISDALGVRGLTDEFGLTKGPKTPASAKKLERKAAAKTEQGRLARAGLKAEKGETRYASKNKFGSAPSMGINTRKTFG